MFSAQLKETAPDTRSESGFILLNPTPSLAGGRGWTSASAEKAAGVHTTSTMWWDRLEGYWRACWTRARGWRPTWWPTGWRSLRRRSWLAASLLPWGTTSPLFSGFGAAREWPEPCLPAHRRIGGVTTGSARPLNRPRRNTRAGSVAFGSQRCDWIEAGLDAAQWLMVLAERGMPGQWSSTLRDEFEEDAVP